MLRRITSYVRCHHVALLALFLALGGTSFAAANLINGKQIKPHTIAKNRLTGSAIRSLRGSKGAPGKTGPTGVQGVPGNKGTTGAAGVQAAWSSEYIPGTLLHPAVSTGGAVAHLTFTSPSAGFVLVQADFNIRARNFFDTTSADCHIASQLAAAPAAPTTGSPGYTDQWISGNLPTEYGGGTYLEFNQSTSRVLPVTAGSNAVYLNGVNGPSGGSPACSDALWGPITLTVALVNSNPASTITAH
jgi:hypothetical protein